MVELLECARSVVGVSDVRSSRVCSASALRPRIRR